MPPGERRHRVQIRALPVEMDGHHGPGPAGHQLLGACDIDAKRILPNFAQHRRGPREDYGIGRRNECKIWDDHLVARSNTEHFQTREQRHRPVADRHSVLRAGIPRGAGLEFARQLVFHQKGRVNDSPELLQLHLIHPRFDLDDQRVLGLLQRAGHLNSGTDATSDGASHKSFSVPVSPVST